MVPVRVPRQALGTLARARREEAAVKPPPFTYSVPTTLSDAVALLVEHAEEEPRVLAGGQSLVPLMNFRLAHPGHLVDLRRVAGLDTLRLDGQDVVVGAMVRQATAERSAEVALAAPVLAEALGQVGHPPLRHSGTVVGSIAHADPAAELPAVAVALDAEMTAVGPRGERRIPAAEFFQGPFTTALAPDEILTEVRFPSFPGGHAVVEFAPTHGSFAVVGVVALVAVTDGRVTRAALAASGVAPTPARLTAAEAALVGTAGDEAAVEAAVDAGTAGLAPAGDVHAGAATRIDLARACLRQGIRRALDRARDRR
jgi:aerobic carbon-monoxide dehydrogenase medium subunit